MPARSRLRRKQTATKAAKRRTRAKAPARRHPVPVEDQGETIGLLREREAHAETSPSLTGGDVDADWQRAYSSGEEAVGGSAATPDQDIVDEIGHALGVEQAADAEVRTSREILERRTRHYWHVARDVEAEDEP